MEIVEIECRCIDCKHSRKTDSKWSLFRHCYLDSCEPELDPEMYPIVEDDDFCSRGESLEKQYGGE